MHASDILLNVDFLNQLFYAKGAKKSNWAGRGATGLQLHEESILLKKSPEDLSEVFTYFVF